MKFHKISNFSKPKDMAITSMKGIPAHTRDPKETVTHMTFMAVSLVSKPKKRSQRKRECDSGTDTKKTATQERQVTAVRKKTIDTAQR